jgi:uridine kinase
MAASSSIVTPPAVQQVAARVLERRERSRIAVTVAIDGVDGVGKTTFAALLAQEPVATGVAVHQASIDDFHFPRDMRYRRGRMDPRGYVEESFDHAAFARLVLDPLEPGGDGLVRLRHHDLVSDAYLDEPPVKIEAGDIVIVDGVFLQSELLRDRWGLVVFLDAPFEATVARAIERDCTENRHEREQAAVLARTRYVPGQRLYLTELAPRERADIVVDHTIPATAQVARSRVC